jgi:hypothetical protein
MGAPARSLVHLQGCADGLREAMEGGVLHGDQVSQDSDRKCKVGLQGHHRPDSSSKQVEAGNN